ncbi:hypothetical protein L6452_36551 [Arctium lappa]|uniref:Uncharacterized protein n=1 Tax=Arctium lappa TaxID=4217 RepID=A0ACB8Y8T1_ARCLA|nr:hypothetical protein L6452_36551 [Arctium lappa]
MDFQEPSTDLVDGGRRYGGTATATATATHQPLPSMEASVPSSKMSLVSLVVMVGVVVVMVAEQNREGSCCFQQAVEKMI